MPADLVDRYSWVNGIEAWTIAVISGRTLDEVVRIYGGDPMAPLGELTFAEVDERRAGGPVEFYLQLVSLGEVVVGIENDGYSGSLPEIARRCSSGGGQLFSVQWNVHAAGMVTQAVDGAVIARFESLFPVAPEPRGGDLRPEWAIGATVDPDAAWQVCMAQLELGTGVAVEQAWLDSPRPTYRLPDPYELYRDVPGAEHTDG